MSYLVLARRWRPQRFSDLVGQDVVIQTLKNSLESGNLAHAYLLCGIRGVGKTTIARLMAMAVNCQHPDQGEPCRECAACKGIAAGSNLDVQEMDAASHTGVDDVREILDGVRYPPNSLKTKVYIIDEAHMLSKSAFNALLKTLEEPPARVLFILATTESDKLPVTVRSRCQRFDLRRLGQTEISDYLQHVFAQEKVPADAAALAAIAQAADGSVRDALSLAERVLAYSSEHLSLDAVHSALGMVDGELIRSLAEHILAGRAEKGLGMLRAGIASGHAPRSILQEIGRLWHHLACRLIDTTMMPSAVEPEQSAWLEKYAGSLSYAALDLRYQVLLTGLRDLGLLDERMGAEMLVLRLSGLHQIAPIVGGSLEVSGSRSEAATQSAAQPVAQSNTHAREIKRHAEPVSHSVNSSEVPATPEAPIHVETPVEKNSATIEPDLPLHAAGNGGQSYCSWQEAVDAFGRIKPGVAAMLDHVVCHEFAGRIRLALDKHQERAIAAADRLAFAEWLGREILWEARLGDDGETLSQERARQSRAEAARLRQNAEHDPHVQALMKDMDAQLVKVTPAGVDVETGEAE